uniref:RRM domain-containing protein n=1 Tax=Panagrellus redivivus TaxID=6233 RepID=A0A7E4W6Y1_PANRE
MTRDRDHRRRDSSSRSRSRSRSPDRRRSGRKTSPKESRSHRGESPHLSRFYRKRFGDQSPDHYNNLRMSNFDPELTNEQIKGILESEFKYFDNFEVKIIRHKDDDERFAYVNFSKPGCAKEIRRQKIPNLKRKLGNDVCLDPTGVLRDQEGKYIPDRYNRTLLERRDQSPVRRRSPPRDSGRYSDRDPIFKLNANRPTRTLFVGNLPKDVREPDLRALFSKYGTIEDIDVKLVSGGGASYAFILFTTIDEAEKARERQHERPFGRSGQPLQIGFGKSQVSRRLWVGDLHGWASKSLLEKEFDRYGEVEDVEYNPDDDYGYVTFVEIAAATDAYKALQGSPLDKTHNVKVDYAKVQKAEKRKRPRTPSPSPPKRARGPRTPSSESSRASSAKSRSNSPQSRAGSNSGLKNGQTAEIVDNVEKLRQHAASTWKGQVMLKKVNYPVSLHRIYGSEHVIQDYLRDDEGVAYKLSITQRLPLDDALTEKFTDSTESKMAIGIGVPTRPDKNLSDLVAYLKDKNATGVITKDKTNTYILGNCSYTQRIIRDFTPSIKVLENADDPDLLVIIVVERTDV